jgi:hypothetical protein
MEYCLFFPRKIQIMYRSFDDLDVGRNSCKVEEFLAVLCMAV